MIMSSNVEESAEQTELVPANVRSTHSVEDDGNDPTVAAEEKFVEDGRGDRALDLIVDVLTRMGMDCTVDLMENEPEDPESDIRIEISGNDAARLVGKKGETLAALQFICNRVINRPTLPRRHVLIDADGYRQRREGALAQMAKNLGKQAIDEGKSSPSSP